MADPGDLVSINIDTRAVSAALDGLQKDIDRASKQALRAAARKVVSRAKAVVPVYDGDNSAVPKGRLKKAIKQSKQIRRKPGGFSVSVGPWGTGVNLYRGKIEARSHFMAQARAEAETAMIEAYVSTFNAAMSRFGR